MVKISPAITTIWATAKKVIIVLFRMKGNQWEFAKIIKIALLIIAKYFVLLIEKVFVPMELNAVSSMITEIKM